MRSVFLVDGGAADAWEKALASDADALLCDGVALLANGAAARAARGRGTLILAKIRPLASGFADADLDAVMPLHPDAIVLPGACGGRDVQHLGAKLAVREAENALADGVTKILAFCAETPSSLFELGTLARSTRRLIGFGWRPEVLAAALGAAPDAESLRVARSMLLFAAATAGIPAYDAAEAGQGEIFARACAKAAREGFRGRFVRSADQARAVNAAFGAFPPPLI